MRLAARADAANWLCADLEEDTVERLLFMQHSPKRSLIIGPHTGILKTHLDSSDPSKEATVDVLPDMDEEQPEAFGNDVGAFDCIVSLNRLDTINDLPGALLHMRSALAPGGITIAHFPAAGSLPALRSIMLAADGDRPAPRIHPQIDNRAATGLLQRAGFSRQVTDSHTLTVRYGTLARMIADLREQALTSVLLSGSPSVGKAGYARALDAFEALKDDDGRVSETFEILTLTGWR